MLCGQLVHFSECALKAKLADNVPRTRQAEFTETLRSFCVLIVSCCFH